MKEFPILDWITINGRSEPFTLPQHEKENGDFVITGENNPLPSANYIQNSNGLWLPVSEDNPVPTQLTGSNVEYDNPIPVKETSSVIEHVNNDTLTIPEPEIWTPIFEDIEITGYSILKFVLKFYGVNASNVSVRYITSDRQGDYEYNATSGVWIRKDMENESARGIVFEVLNPQPLVGKYLKIEAKHSSEGSVMKKTRVLIQINGR